MTCTAAASGGDRSFLWSDACPAAAAQQSQLRSRSTEALYWGFDFSRVFFLWFEKNVFFCNMFATGTYGRRGRGRPSPTEYAELQYNNSRQLNNRRHVSDHVPTGCGRRCRCGIGGAFVLQSHVVGTCALVSLSDRWDGEGVKLQASNARTAPDS